MLTNCFSKKSNILFLILIIIPIPFFERFSDLMNSKLIDPVFNSIEKSYLNDTLFGIVILIVIAFTYFSSNKIIVYRPWYRYHIALGTYYYMIFRIFGSNWKFIELKLVPFLCYTDLLLLPSIAILIKYRLVNNKILINSTSISHKQPYLLDAPTNNDYLHRTDLATNVAHRILSTFKPDEQSGTASFAIGVVGEWGTGKTTFFGLIKQQLKSNQPVILDFTPWRNFDNKSIFVNYFDILSEALQPYNPELSSQLQTYAKQFIEIDDNLIFKAIDFAIKITDGDKSLEKRVKDINESIIELKRQIIVFIDDLDRLDQKEIIEVIKLIRSVADFQNTVFVVAYDKDYVIKALHDFTKHEANTFLEKIFLAEHLLPIINFDTVCSQFRDLLLKSINTSDKRYDDELNRYFSIDTHYVNDILRPCIKSIRDIKRFINTFSSEFQLVSNYVLLDDFLNLSLIKFKFPTLYNRILNESVAFLKIPKSGIYNAVSGSNLVQQECDNSVMDELKFSEEDKLIVKTLFGGSEIEGLPTYRNNEIDDRTIKSIRIASNREIYFSLSVWQTKITNFDFIQKKNSSEDKFREYCFSFLDSKEKSIEIKSNFEIINYYDSLDDYCKILKTLVKIAIEYNSQLESHIQQLNQTLFFYTIRKHLQNKEVLFKNYESKTVEEKVQEYVFSTDSAQEILILAGILFQDKKALLRHSAIITFYSSDKIDSLLELYLKQSLSISTKFIDNQHLIWKILYMNRKQFKEDTSFDINSNNLKQILEFAQSKDLTGFFESIIQYDYVSNKPRYHCFTNLFVSLFGTGDQAIVEVIKFINQSEFESQELKSTLIDFYSKFKADSIGYLIDFSFKKYMNPSRQRTFNDYMYYLD